MIKYNKVESALELVTVDRNSTTGQLCAVYLELDLRSDPPSLEWYTRLNCENGRPFYVHDGLAIEFTARYAPSADDANSFTERVLPLCERIAAGHGIVIENGNHVGKFTADAEEAELEISNLIESAFSDKYAIYSAADYIGDERFDGAERVIERAAADGIILDKREVERVLERIGAQ